MAYRKAAASRGNRHQLWSKELFKEEVEKSSNDDTISSICRRWALDDKIQGLTNDVKAWRAEDPELDHLCLDRFGSAAGGRPSKEGEDPDWRLAFCEKYLETRSRVKAAESTPYSYETLIKKLDPGREEFDRVFFDMLEAAEMKLLDKAEQVMHDAIDHETSWRNKAWIAKEILKARDRRRWGDNVNIKVEGSVQHVLERGRVVGQLVDEQRKFLERQRLSLESGEEIVAEVIEDE